MLWNCIWQIATAHLGGVLILVLVDYALEQIKGVYSAKTLAEF